MARKEFDVNIMDNEKPSLILNDESIIYLSVGAKIRRTRLCCN